ncbi:MAG TPA: FkbM family methyltransferase [Cytophagaceae bacterium]|nr:FkbM family methyltransferase [Cytophagaceae bacterium]
MIFLNHVKLIFISFMYHRLKKHSPEQEKKIRIMGYNISFFNFPFLINQFEEIFIYSSYHFKSANKNPFILDCGSNIGMSVLYFTIFYPGSRIVAFEPDPDNFRVLEKNIDQNRFSNITAYNYALGLQEGSCKLFNSQSGKGSLNTSIYANKPDAVFINVPMKRLSSFIQEEIDFVKIDAEGAEGEIIQELSEAGKLSRIKVMIIEYHLKCYLPEDKLIFMLKNAGFTFISEHLLYAENTEKLLSFKKTLN